ncbi:hypothetical protein MTO96_020435 [Rhipicephalus appendiculatus]
MRALVAGFKEIKAALNELSEDPQERAETKHEAKSLLKAMSTLETALMAEFWNRVLQRFNATSKALQSPTVSLNAAVSLMKSLCDYLSGLRQRFHEIEKLAKEASDNASYNISSQRKRRQSTRYDSTAGTSTPEPQDPSAKFRCETFFVMIDNLVHALTSRLNAYTEVCSQFAVITDWNCFSPAQRRLQAMDLVKKYPSDLANTFPDELEQFISYASNEGCSSVADMLKLLIREKLEGSFPDVHVALRIFLCLMVTNCTGERSFSKLKFIKNRLRSTMTDSRLRDLSLLSVETEVLRRVNVEELINKMSQQKARKRL